MKVTINFDVVKAVVRRLDEDEVVTGWVFVWELAGSFEVLEDSKVEEEAVSWMAKVEIGTSSITWVEDIRPVGWLAVVEGWRRFSFSTVDESSIVELGSEVTLSTCEVVDDSVSPPIVDSKDAA